MSSTIKTGSSPPTLSIRSLCVGIAGWSDEAAVGSRTEDGESDDTDAGDWVERSGEAGAEVYKLFDDTMGIMSWSDISR